ncbi:MAG: outer membrane protein assembly factor [bacterium]|nr:outer membrane protein assembly factor [bacterium]
MAARPNHVHSDRARRALRAWSTALTLAYLLTTQAALADVRIEGLDGRPLDNVQATLSIARAEAGTPIARIHRLHARAQDEICRALQPFGYYAPRIESDLTEDGDDWQAHYVIDPGPQVHVANTDVRILGAGAADSTFVSLAADFPLARGDPLDHAAFERGKFRLLDHAARHGYFDAAFDSAVVLVTVHEQRADVVVHLDSGPRHLFGLVRLNQDVLEDRMVAGYVTVRPGDPYDVQPLLEMQAGLGSGPYFAGVEIVPGILDADSLRVPVTVNLFPARTQRWEFGLGYGTDTGVRGKVGAQWRRLNRSGHHAEALLQASQIEYSASGRYNIPWPYPSTRLLALFGGVGFFDPDWSESWRVAVGTSYAHSRWGGREVISLAYEYEDFTVAGQDGTSRLVIPGVSWTRVRADDRIIPQRGYRLRLDAKGAHESLLSSVSFVQLRAEIKAIRGLGPRVRLIGRGTTARTFTDAFTALPPTQRFVTGGDQTVRGYGFESLGPEDADGAIVGGNTLAILSGELECRFLDDWGVATFLDSGQALTDFSGKLSVGAGGGLRWFSPIGIVRLDVAFGLSEPGSPLHLHLAIGPDL